MEGAHLNARQNWLQLFQWEFTEDIYGLAAWGESQRNLQLIKYTKKYLTINILNTFLRIMQIEIIRI